jgi:hypothetical protein
VLHAVKRTAGRAAGALDVPRARVGDIGFERADVDLAMSRVSERLLDRLDFEDIRQRRIRNFADLAERLDGTVSLLCRETAGGICPLFLPVLVDDKAAAAQSLRRQGIEALEFWNADGDGAATSGAQPARFLRAHVLGLPIHQDLTPRHVAVIGDQVSRLAPCLSLQ